MARFGKGKISKARHKLKKDKKKKGITRFLKTFEINEKATIVIDSSSQNYPHPRYHGLTGKIVGRRGRAYIISVRTGKKIKELIITPEHLKKI
ncbi:MAG TPA: 50S ribosomal protein L21e [Candidatus Aenigmarchaeota archaeon]|nr:50S ribosomal protein L21e [Candidatus Aenigmarchaeota archaeon]